MFGVTHASVGFGTSLALMQIFPSIMGHDGRIGMAFVGGTILGSVLPDLDCATSNITRLTITSNALSGIFERLFGHRGFVHTPLFGALLSWLCAAYILEYIPSASKQHIWIMGVSGLAIGFATHLILDMCNPMGIMLIYPFSKKRYAFVKNNEFRYKNERFIASIALAIGIFLFITH